MVVQPNFSLLSLVGTWDNSATKVPYLGSGDGDVHTPYYIMLLNFRGFKGALKIEN